MQMMVECLYWNLFTKKLQGPPADIAPSKETPHKM